MEKILVNDIIPILVIMILGYLCGKFSFFDDDQRQALNKLVLNIALPAALFISIVAATRAMFAKDIVLTLISIFGPGRWRPLHFTLYFLIGWSGLVFLPSFYLHARTLLWFILMGGVVYTLGMIPFARNRKYDHCIWHVFVLLAAALHWAGIYTQLY